MLHFISHISDNRNDLVMDININLKRSHFKGVLSSPCLCFTSPLLLWECKHFLPHLAPPWAVCTNAAGSGACGLRWLRKICQGIENKRYATFRNDFGLNVSLTVKLSYNPTRLTEGKIDIASLSHFTKHWGELSFIALGPDNECVSKNTVNILNARETLNKQIFPPTKQTKHI